MKNLILFLTAAITFSNADALAQCPETELVSALTRLEGKAKLHHCQIELVSRYSPYGEKHYMLLVNDMLFEMTVPHHCLPTGNEVLSTKTLRHSYGYRTHARDYKVAIEIQMGFGYLPTRMTIQNIDLISHQIDQRVKCQKGGEDL